MVAHGRRVNRLAAACVLAMVAVLLPGAVVHAAVTITVNTTADDVDAAPGDGVCATAADQCSLRAAVQTVDALGYGNTIVIPAGTYTLSRPYDANDLTGAYGDLDIVGSQTLKGAGSGKTIIEQAGATPNDAVDRVFDVRTDSAVVKFSGMTIRNGHGVNFGGGISVSATSIVTLEDVALKGNVATSGGGIFGQGQLTITDSVISGNVAGSASGIAWAGNLTVTDSTISGNTSTSAFADGAVRFTRVPGAPASTLVVDRSLISGNTAPTAGAVSIGEGLTDTSSAIIRNSTITNNHATDAGAAVIRVRAPAQLDFESATVAFNDAPAIDPPSKAAVAAKNTIFASNGSQSCLAVITSKGHNIDAGSSCGLHGTGDQSSTNPKLQSLAANGGPTKTLGLADGSPAIDAGAGCPSVDQRGRTRPKDGNGDGTKVCDIGAFEHATVALALPSPSPDATAGASPTPEITAEPSGPAPTSEPTGSVTIPPTLAAGSAGPDGASAEPTPAASPAPAGSGSSGADGSWIILVVIAAAIALLAVFSLRRRRSSAG